MNIPRLTVWLVLFGASSCATDYVARTSHVRRAYESHQYDAALRALESVEKENRTVDQLLILLDRGMLLHSQGEYQKSIRVLAEAEKLSDKLDVISISQEATTLLTNERERAYKGEDFEKLMINVLQALNYTQLGLEEDALVEVRRINERLRKMINDQKKPYEQLALARYLGGMLYEDQKQEDSAIIDYQAAMKLQPQLGQLAEPLLRLSLRTGRDELYHQLRTHYPNVEHSNLKPNEGQLVVLVEAGKAPQKVSERRETPQLIVLPRFVLRGQTGAVKVSAGTQTSQTAVTVTSISSVAQVHLADRIGRLLAQQIAGAAVKAGVATALGAATGSRDLGGLAFLLLQMNNDADLRSWLSLPADFKLARFRLPEGTHQVTVDASGGSRTYTVTVKRGRIAFLIHRAY